LMNCEDKTLKNIDQVQLSLADKWILTKLNATVKSATELIEKFELGMACQEVYDFVWTNFCDWYIELSKPVLYGTDDEARIGNLSVLCYVLDKMLKLLHPFVPFITEKIYQSLPQHEETIMKSAFPVFEEKYDFADEAQLMEEVKDLISRLRNVRAEYGVAPSKRLKLAILAKDERLKDCKVYVEKLVGAEKIDFVDKFASGEKVVKTVAHVAEVEIPLGELVDFEKEAARLAGELEKAQNEIARANAKLANPGFVAKAPAQLVEQEKEKLAKFVALEAQIRARIDELNS